MWNTGFNRQTGRLKCVFHPTHIDLLCQSEPVNLRYFSTAFPHVPYSRTYNRMGQNPYEPHMRISALSAVIVVPALKRVLYDTRHNYSIFKVQLTTRDVDVALSTNYPIMWTRDVTALCMVSPCQLSPTDRFCLAGYPIKPTSQSVLTV